MIIQSWKKCPKCGENLPFWDILNVFSRKDECIDLNPFAFCQASSGTSLECPHGVLWWDMQIAIFCPRVHLLGDLKGKKLAKSILFHKVVFSRWKKTGQIFFGMNFIVIDILAKLRRILNWGINPRAQKWKTLKWPKINQFPFLGQNQARNIENGSIPVHGSNKIGNMTFELKNIDISVKTTSNPSKMIIWPTLRIYSKSTEMNGLNGHFGCE